MVSTSDASLPEPTLKVVDIKSFQLLTGFDYVDPVSGTTYHVPPQLAGQTTDLASVPSLLWGLVAPYGHQLLPALLHDHRCDLADVAKKASGRTAAPPIRTEGDLLFRRGLQDRGVPWSRRWLMWAAVSLDGYFAYDIAALALTVLALVAGFISLVAGIGWLHGWTQVAVLIAPGLVGFTERRHLAVAALGTYGLPLALVAGVGTAVAGLVIWLVPSGLSWLFQSLLGAVTFGVVPKPGPPPIFGPTALRRSALRTG